MSLVSLAWFLEMLCVWYGIVILSTYEPLLDAYAVESVWVEGEKEGDR